MLELWKYFKEESEIAKGYCSWFLLTFPPTEFVGLDRVMYDFMEYTSSLNMSVSELAFNYYVKNDLRPFLKETKIHVEGTDNMSYDNPQAAENIIQTITNLFRQSFYAMLEQPIELKEFPASAREFIQTQLSTKMVEVISDSFRTLQDTENASEVISSHMDAVTKLQYVYDLSALELLEDSTRGDKLTLVGKTGIDVVDRDMQGYYTTRLYGIEAAPGSGKTRTAIQSAHIAATEFGTNVLYIALEQVANEIKAMFISRHIYTHIQPGSIVPDQSIIRYFAGDDEALTEEWRQKVEAAKIELFESDTYGKIKIVDYTQLQDFNVDNFVVTIRMLDKLYGPFQMTVMDYMSLIEPSHSIKEDFQVTRYVYRRSKRLCQSANMAIIALQQFNRAGIIAGAKDEVITTDMAQGGIEVYRSADYNMALSRTEEMRSQSKVRLSQPKVRGSRGFPSTVVTETFGACYISDK